MLRLLLTAAATTALMVSPVLADPGDWSSDSYDVVALSESCAMTSTFDFAGRASVEFSLHFDGESALFFLTSSDWSTQDGQAYDDLVYGFFDPDTVYRGGQTKGVAQRSVYKGFVTSFPPEALKSFAAPERLMVFRQTLQDPDTITVVADLNLAGSGDAVSALRRCARVVSDRNAAQERRERRLDYIERDPFKPDQPGSPERVGSGLTSFSRAPRPEFPARALERGIASASVRLSCDASPTGSPSDCRIVSETPAGMGFGRAALSSLAAALFSPGTVAGGGRHEFSVIFAQP